MCLERSWAQWRTLELETYCFRNRKIQFLPLGIFPKMKETITLNSYEKVESSNSAMFRAILLCKGWVHKNIHEIQV